MFVQVIQGQVTDPAQVRSALDRWTRDLSPGADGWLGTTAGVTADGQFIAIARFESEAAARRNSDRPEQGKWWADTEQLFTGEVTFHDSEKVQVDLVGDPDAAGFVQIIQGQSSDPERAFQLSSEDSDAWAAFRPDILGSMAVAHDGNQYTMVLYFTSEEAAREGEKKEPPHELQTQMKEMESLEVGEPRFYDLREPWLDSPS